MSVHRSKEVYSHIKQLLDIPDDEPIFILRAQDKFAIKLLQMYRNLVRDGVKPKNRDSKFNDWFENIGSIIVHFVHWQKNNRDKVKVPD